jgi:hypothetical protein
VSYRIDLIEEIPRLPNSVPVFPQEKYGTAGVADLIRLKLVNMV